MIIDSAGRTSRAVAAAWAIVAMVPLAIVPTAYGQEQISEPAAELGDITVTGSRIRRPTVEGPTPLIVITREDIDNQGFGTIQDVFDSVVQNTSGSVAQTQTFGFTPAASSPRLRGFNSGFTLVLIDGRRPPVYPLGQGAEDTFVDFASIPLSMVERIEILTDGASAVYGADAVAGVINIITRQDFQGLDFNFRFADTADGGYGNRRAEMVGGAEMGRTSVMFTAEWYDQEILWATDRDWADGDIPTGRNPADIPLAFNSIGGASFVNFDTAAITQAPGCGTPAGPLGGLGIPDQAIPIFTSSDVWCGFDRAKYRTLFPANDMVAVTGHVNHEISPDMEFFSKAHFSVRDTFWQLEPNFYGSTAVFTPGPSDEDALFPSSVTNNGIIPAGAPNNPIGATADGIFTRRMLEMGPRTNHFETTTYGALAGVRGSIGGTGWEWEGAVAYNRQEVSNREPNFIISAFEAELQNGLDLFQPVPQSVLDGIAFQSATDGESTNRTVDLTVTGDLGVELPGGPLALAVHGDWERQTFEDRRDPLVLRGDAFDGATEAAGARDHWGIGAELLFPVLPVWELGAAVRFDEYNDASQVGNAVSPRLTSAWRPTDRLLVRASWGESFRAPDLQDLFGGLTRAFQTVIDSPRCIALGGVPGDGDPASPFECNTPVQSVQINVQGNPGLKEEEGQNYNIGVVWEIIDDMNLSVDYFNIELEDLVDTPDEQYILDSCAFEGRLCDKIIRDGAGQLNGGSIQQVPVNLSLQSTDGFDVKWDYRHDIPVGSLAYQLDATWTSSLETQFDANSAVTENIRLATLPELRAGMRVDWAYADHGVTLRGNFVDDIPGIQCSAPPGAAQCPGDTFSDSYWHWNGQYRYDIGRNGRITFGINNIFDEIPPIDPTARNWPYVAGLGSNTTGLFYSFAGREYFLSYQLSVL